MPSLDIAIAQSSFQNNSSHLRLQHIVIGTMPHHIASKNDNKWASVHNSFQSARNLNFNFGHHNKKSRNKFFVKCVATFEPSRSVIKKDYEKRSEALLITTEPYEDSEEIDEREKLRRIRISKANRGNTPWNKGRKHSPETLQRIRERTKLAMQNPKVKMKLANIGHAQSEETRKKIAVGVRTGWAKRREKLMLQETCLFDWHNLIADVARRGFQGEEELQWDSYKIINEQLQEEWLASIEQRKTKPRPKDSKRAPKSLEQRKKIAEAIAAKWADPEYRSRVCNGLAKHYGIPEGAERKKRKPRDNSQVPKIKKNKAIPTELKVKAQQPKLKERATPKYKDPLANSKLEMLKSIRSQRVVLEGSKNEALEQAKLLIVEAEKAAKALEIAAMKSPVARASLIEARKLIAEATQLIEAIENKEFTPKDEFTIHIQNQAKKDESHVRNRGVNGSYNGIAQTSNSESSNTSFYKMPKLEETGENHQIPSRLGEYEFPKLSFGSFIGTSKSRELIDQKHLHDRNSDTKVNGFSNHHLTKLQIPEDHVSDTPLKKVAKKWVRGRLVEVSEGN